MKENKEKPIILFPINASPPNFGHIIAINTLLKMAQKIIIIVYDKSEIMTADISINILNSILSNYADFDKIKIIKSAENFAKLSEIPDNFKIPEKAYTIATTSRHIYANLYSKGYPYLIFIRKPIGWKDEFYTIAFMRSMALYNIESTNFESERRYLYDKKK